MGLGGPPGTTPPAHRPPRQTNPLVIGVVVGIVVLIALITMMVSTGDDSKREETGKQTTTAAETKSEQKLSVTFTTPSGLTVNTPNATLEGVTEPGAQVTSFSFTYQLDEASYKAQCQTIDFRVLNKKPDAYMGKKYFATGQVVQIMESLGSTDIRLNVTQDQWGYWDDTIYVTYSGSVPAYEDSIIKVWGEIQGSYTYTSVAGWTITLPWVEARYIEVVQP